MPSVFCGATGCLPLAFCDAMHLYMHGNFSCYHSLCGFVVVTQMVLQALWELPIRGKENILSIYAYMQLSVAFGTRQVITTRV